MININTEIRVSITLNRLGIKATMDKKKVNTNYN